MAHGFAYFEWECFKTATAYIPNPLKLIMNKNRELRHYNIKQIIENTKNDLYKAVNFSMIIAYWEIGKIIVEK